MVGDIPPDSWNLRTGTAIDAPIVDVDDWSDFIGRTLRVNRSSEMNNLLVSRLSGQEVTLTIGNASVTAIIGMAYLLDTDDELSDVNIEIINLLNVEGIPSAGDLIISDVATFTDIIYRINVPIRSVGVGKHFYMELTTSK